MKEGGQNMLFGIYGEIFDQEHFMEHYISFP
jgi:hypothetical protein